MPIEKNHRRLLLAVCTALFFMPFMMAGVNAVLPPLGESLRASARQLGLVGAFYSLGLAVFQLASGSLGDICGRRRVFLWGMGVFALAGALLGFVDSAPLFLVLRFVQGVGGAMFNASGLALLASAAPPGQLCRYCLRPARGRIHRGLAGLALVVLGQCSGRRRGVSAHEVLRQAGMAHGRGPAL